MKYLILLSLFSCIQSEMSQLKCNSEEFKKVEHESNFCSAMYGINLHSNTRECLQDAMKRNCEAKKNNQIVLP